MQKLKVFFRTFVKSTTSFSYYKEVVIARFKFSLKYFAFFSLLTGLLLTVGTSLAVLPPVNNFLNRLGQKAYDLYPQELVISVKGGEVTTNANEPLRVPVPYDLFTDTPPAISDQKQTYLVTIDTNAQVSDFETSQSLIFVTRDAVVGQDDGGGYRVYPIDKTTNFTLDKNLVNEFWQKFLPVLRFVPFAIVVFFFCIFAIFLPLSRLVSLVFLTVPLMFAAKLMQLTISYKKLFQIGLHALTLPTLIQIFMTAFNINPRVPFFNSLLYLLYGLIILATLKEKVSAPPAPISS